MKVCNNVPVLVELNSKIRKRGQSFVRECHVSIDHTTTATECAGDLQTFPHSGWKPHLQGRSQQEHQHIGAKDTPLFLCLGNIKFHAIVTPCTIFLFNLMPPQIYLATHSFWSRVEARATSCRDTTKDVQSTSKSSKTTQCTYTPHGSSSRGRGSKHSHSTQRSSSSWGGTKAKTTQITKQIKITQAWGKYIKSEVALQNYNTEVSKTSYLRLLQLVHCRQSQRW